VTLFDYLVIGTIAVSLLVGAWRGVVSEILALGAWVVAFIVARELGKPVAGLLPVGLGEPLARLSAGYALVFVGVLLLVALARLLVRELMKAVGLGMVDRLLGAVFGVLRGLAIVVLAVAVGGMTALPREGWWRAAWTAPPLETIVVAGKPWLPPDVAARIRFH